MNVNEPLYDASADRVRNALRQAGVKTGRVRAEIAGHGQYETTAQSLDEMINEYWPIPLRKLYRELKERQGDPEYDTTGLTKIETIMILAELSGLATN